MYLDECLVKTYVMVQYRGILKCTFREHALFISGEGPVPYTVCMVPKEEQAFGGVEPAMVSDIMTRKSKINSWLPLSLYDPTWTVITLLDAHMKFPS